MATTWPQIWQPAATELHVFDPEGDVLLVFTRSSSKNDIAQGTDFGSTSVDYYQLHEAIDFFSDHWLSTLARACTNKAAGYGCQYPQQDLWISWVFQDARTFKRMSGSFVQTGKDGFDSSDGSDTSTEIMKEKVDHLPIPSSIPDTIKLYRNHIISDIIEIIHELITNTLRQRLVVQPVPW
ncbi:uncharacterized protein RAG0_14695 [Rhynchosporium agropyri]|uniref:Uncharacterized protein n=1 Tax=Rhynchosporium agropyri TaxID=914238 RepID=A0A1E1LI25_9HELO|nr:uncharacterized protein RAG0_14695 [Rhynchosporium agropyri]